MEGSSLNTLVTDMDIKILEGLLGAFGSAFSLVQIANAYSKAGRNAYLTGAMLYDLSNSTSMQLSSTLPKSDESSEASHGDVFEKSSHTVLESSNPGNSHVSGVLGKSHVTHVVNESKEFHVPELWSEESSSNLAKDFGTNNVTEECLFKTLGEGFRLDRDMIKEILGCCGDDLHKSTDRGPKLEPISCAEGILNLDLKANGSKLPIKQRGHDAIQQEILSDLSHVPQSSKELLAGTFGVNVVQNSIGSGQLVVEPSMDTTVECKTDKIDPHNAIEEDDEEVRYLVLRKAVSEHRATMKEYYKSAAEAFAKGDVARAGRLLEQGQLYYKKAREADEESAGILYKPRIEDTMTLDLHDHVAKEAIPLLKFHLSSLSGIPSMKYLKVIVETNDEDRSKKSHKRRLIIRLLKIESITWIEGDNSGTILIPLEEINPKRLSFAGK